jgi:hypothetical protein
VGQGAVNNNNKHPVILEKAFWLTFLPSSRPHSHASYSETLVDIDRTHRDYTSPIDAAEREYRSRVQPNYREEVRITGTTVDAPAYRSGHKASSRVSDATVDPPHHVPVYHREATVIDETVEAPTYSKSNMGYYDDDGKSRNP